MLNPRNFIISSCCCAHKEYIAHIYSLETDYFERLFLLFVDMTETENIFCR